MPDRGIRLILKMSLEAIMHASPHLKRSQLPAGIGVGFKPEHFGSIETLNPSLSFFEVHAENYMSDGGPALKMLDRLRQDYALSVHGVGLSIGGEAALDLSHLARVKAVCERFEPESFSEHLAWSTHDDVFLNDLLPLPYTKTNLDRVCAHIDQIQTFLRRQILMENPSTYLIFTESTFSEVEFIRAMTQRTGCGLLLDVNNVHVSAVNHGFSAADYIADFPLADVREIHVAGHAVDDAPGETLLIDTHDRPVAPDVWTCFAYVIARTGEIPTLLEWDRDVPAFETLYAEACKAAALMADEKRRAVA